MTEICDLPNELLIHICRLAPRAACRILCRVSHRFNAICRPIIYGEIHVSLPSATLIQLFRTLSRSKVAASDVRNLSVKFKPQRGYLYLRSFMEAISRAVTSIQPYLTGLTFDFEEEAGIVSGLLGCCTFPQLESFILQCPDSYAEDNATTIYEFVCRHHNLQTLRLPSQRTAATMDISRPVVLPRLTSFSGPKEWLEILAPSSPLSAIFIDWRDTTPGGNYFQIPVDVSRVSKALRSFAPSAHLFTTFIPEWDPRLALLLGELVNLTVISIEVSSLSDDFQPLFMAALENLALPAFSQLEVIKVTKSLVASSPTPPTRVEELRVVCRWHKACPTLRGVELSESRHWVNFRYKPHEVPLWYSVPRGSMGSDSDIHNNLTWTILAIVTDQYPARSDPSRVHEAACMLRNRVPQWRNRTDVDVVQKELEDITNEVGLETDNDSGSESEDSGLSG
ncbi:hypothetical protein HGRIS_004146 [Hohenbuehelia grisea]|uniref:F-box domain-containing protein n=1 Tax=Hohenbuehelia grisea TaxID=104357 RepID=A0ABR3JI51_9AGAR